MTKDEFCGLPLGLALGAIFDANPGLAAAPKIAVPLPPKFDMRVTRRAGMYCYASEMLLPDLLFWHKRYVDGSRNGGQWAAKDGKRAEDIERWIKWRAAFPGTLWRGKRDNDVLTAAPPSRDPDTYSWKRESRGNSAPADDSFTGGSGDDDGGAVTFDDSEIPF